jgi:hypothetical protein
VKSVEKSVGGRRKLKDVMGFVDKARKGEVEVVGDGASGAGGFSSDLLQKGKSSFQPQTKTRCNTNDTTTKAKKPSSSAIAPSS